MAEPAMAQATDGPGGSIAVLLFVAIVLFIYMIPTVVAFRRRHPNRWVIGVLNLVLGGTGIVWLGCLVWACGAVHKSAEASGSDGGESGLNVFANDIQKVALVDPSNAIRDDVGQLERLKQLLDAQVITKDEFDLLKSKVFAPKA
ncbi:MAG: superinfection immunity protein [Pseudomonadota bacterium]